MTERIPASASDRQLADLAALAVVGAILAPARLLHGGPTVCPFRRLTGRPCPACGLSRSWNAAARLDLAASLAFHPLGPPTLAAAIVAATGDRRRDGLSWLRSKPILGAFAAIWLGVWLVRLRGS